MGGGVAAWQVQQGGRGRGIQGKGQQVGVVCGKYKVNKAWWHTANTGRGPCVWWPGPPSVTQVVGTGKM